VPESALELIARVVAEGRYTSGANVASLENGLAAKLRGRHVVAVSSGTTAALIACHMLKDDGRRVLVMPDFCFPSVASSALRTGLDVRLADVDPKRWSLDVDSFAEIREEEGVAVLSVDQFGIPGDNERLAALARERNWVFVEDAACALGSVDSASPCGTMCDLAILSFHPRKVLTTGEGGAVVTASERLAEKAKVMRNLGMEGEGPARRFLHQGYNARMSELHAAIGLAQLAELDSLLSHRRTLGAAYLDELAEIPGVQVPSGYRVKGANFQSLVVLLPEGTDRSAVMAGMHRSGVETSLPGFAIHTQPAFKGLVAIGKLPVSLAIHERGLALPLHERMTVEDTRTVANALAVALQRAGRRGR